MIRFIEENHKYLSQDGKELISVSAFMDTFKEKVDWKKKAKDVANKLTKAGTPTTTQEVLAKWENKRKRSSEIGTILHSMKEQELIDDPSPCFYGKNCERKTPSTYVGDKMSIPINSLENNTVYAELMIYDMDHMICGQSDKVIVINNRINIWDYKTDQEIKYKAFSSKWTKPAYFLPPISHLQECNANTYSLKMSLYMYMLWKANKGRFQPGDIIIEHVHLKRDIKNDNIPILDSKGLPVVLKIEHVTLPYRKKEVEAMLKTLK